MIMTILFFLLFMKIYMTEILNPEVLHDSLFINFINTPIHERSKKVKRWMINGIFPPPAWCAKDLMIQILLFMSINFQEYAFQLIIELIKLGYPMESFMKSTYINYDHLISLIKKERRPDARLDDKVKSSIQYSPSTIRWEFK